MASILLMLHLSVVVAVQQCQSKLLHMFEVPSVSRPITAKVWIKKVFMIFTCNDKQTKNMFLWRQSVFFFYLFWMSNVLKWQMMLLQFANDHFQACGTISSVCMSHVKKDARHAAESFNLQWYSLQNGQATGNRSYTKKCVDPFQFIACKTSKYSCLGQFQHTIFGNADVKGYVSF